MMKIALVVLVGIILGWIGGSYFGRVSDRQLVESWRLIKPGSHISEVTASLGDSINRIEPGEKWPGWARKAVSEELWETHGMLVFYIQDQGPNLLVVLFDVERNVTFVTSVQT